MSVGSASCGFTWRVFAHRIAGVRPPVGLCLPLVATPAFIAIHLSAGTYRNFWTLACPNLHNLEVFDVFDRYLASP